MKRYQVKCLQKEGTPSEIIAQSMRMSLKGEASRVVMRLETAATIDDILDKMDGIFRDVYDENGILAAFYSTKQRETEDVTQWGLRLKSFLTIHLFYISQTWTNH